jgi:hypothetical protein
VIALALATWARAQEPEATFRLDPVFVSVFRSPEPVLKERAREVERRLAAALAARHLVVPLADIPAFEDYSAEVYLTSCPTGREAGCAYVVGSRGGAEWAVAGIVTSGGGQSVVVETTLVDVRDSRTVVRFQTTVGSDIGPYAAAVADLVDRVSREGSGPTDIRAVSGSDDLERRKQEEAAAILEMERQLGSLTVREQDAEVTAPRLTKEDVARYSEQEGGAPWEVYRLTPSQYRVLINRGDNVETFKARLRGPAGRMIARGLLTGSTGPWTVRYDGRWVVDPATAEIVQVDAVRELAGGGVGGGGAEVAIGLLPWLDLGIGVQSWVGRYQWLLHPETYGDARVPEPETVTPVGSGFLGPRATVTMLPAREVRPTVTGGIGVWLGPSLARVVDIGSVSALEPVDAPSVVVVHGGAGAEVETSAFVSLFARVEVLVAVSGGADVDQVENQGFLQYPGTRVDAPGAGLTFCGGIQVRTAPLWSRGGD